MDAKIASLTSDIKKNLVNSDDLSRAYVVHERDLYNLAILALKGVESKRLSKQTNDMESGTKTTVKDLQDGDRTEGKEAAPSNIQGGSKTTEEQRHEGQMNDNEWRSELKKILRSDFFSIEAKEILINELIEKFRRETNLAREREITLSLPPHKKGVVTMGGGTVSSPEPNVTESPKASSSHHISHNHPVYQSNHAQSKNLNFSDKLKRAKEEIKKNCLLTKRQKSHLKKVSDDIYKNFPISKKDRLFSTDLNFFFQDNHIVHGAHRFPLPKLLAVFALERSQLFSFLSKRGKLSKFSESEKKFLRKFSKMSSIRTNLVP